MSECNRLRNKNAIVTAGTEGIGLAIVERLASEGANVFLCSRKKENVQKAISTMVEKGYNVGGIVCHVGDLSQLTNFVNEACKFFKSETVDIVVSNAAVNPKAGATLSMSDDIFDKIYSVNVKSYWQLTKLCVPFMPRGSSIIFISSVGGFQPSPPLGLYGVSKTAVISLGKVLANDLGPQGIRVNSICPGIIKTKMSQVFWSSDQSKTNEKKTAYLQRFGEPEDVSGLAAFLASSDSSFITGEAIIVNGGNNSRM